MSSLRVWRRSPSSGSSSCRTGGARMTMTDEQYWGQGSANLTKYVSEVKRIVSCFPELRRKQVNKLLDGDVGSQFMVAPASTRRHYHNAFPCGLVAHSLAVAQRTFEIANCVAPGRWPDHVLGFVGLFHDLGKAGTAGRPHYIYAEDWKRSKGELYEIAKGVMPAAEASLYILQQAGISLSEEEYGAIRLADGMGSRGNADWAFREPDLALVLHWADHWEMRLEKERAR